MSVFALDRRLAADCIVLGTLDISRLLLMNNSLVPWFILVPETEETELTDLSPANQAKILAEINLLADFVKTYFAVTKLNIGAIGNIVSQLHIHLVGRTPADFFWPNVVWGTKERKPYSDKQNNEIAKAVANQLGDKFTRHQ